MDESHATNRGDGRGRGAFGPTATSAATAPDPEVPAKAQRRRFTAEYRLRILKRADACKRPGELGALLRREGLYSSHVANWRGVGALIQRGGRAVAGMLTIATAGGS